MSRPGYVYLMRMETYDPSEHRPHKIGKSISPVARTQQLGGTKLPYDITLLVTIETPDMDRLERELHRRFADRQMQGEWFRLTPDDIAYVIRLSGAAEHGPCTCLEYSPQCPFMRIHHPTALG